MLPALHFWLGFRLGLGIVDVALALPSCTYGLVKIPDLCICVPWQKVHWTAGPILLLTQIFSYYLQRTQNVNKPML